MLASVIGPEHVSNDVGHHLDACIFEKSETFPLGALSLLECQRNS